MISVQVDVAFGDAVKPQPGASEYPAILPLPTPRVHVSPRAAVGAEKSQITLSLGMGNSRM
jgi:hypothetical protein